ncbi:hypothetical protein F0U60_37530 [Archangium minus]|uniref:Uncharacterized protein n=1 Tax=Archangium minus TaxID=83450 RepID=A0ABY9X1B5_9BACT|nr:hypothetical protein F0U60_37530 [Archangium minus]
MTQPSTQKPSLGRVVLFTKAEYQGKEYPVDIVELNPDEGTLTLHVKRADPNKPISVEWAPIEEGDRGSRGRSWRWPPRV